MLHQSLVSEGLAQFMHIGTMEVLDYLQFMGCAVAKVHNAAGDGRLFRQLGCPIAARSHHEFEQAVITTGMGPHQDTLKHTVVLNIGRQFAELAFIIDAARVGLRLDNAVQRDFLNQSVSNGIKGSRSR